jgi:hypothetical protein
LDFSLTYHLSCAEGKIKQQINFTVPDMEKASQMGKMD